MGILYEGEGSKIQKIIVTVLLIFLFFISSGTANSANWEFSTVVLNDDVVGKYLVYFDRTSIKSHKEYKKIWVKKIYEKKQKIDDTRSYNIAEELYVFNCANKTWTKVKWTLLDLNMKVIEESEFFNPFKPEWSIMWGGVAQRTLTYDLYKVACSSKVVKK